MGFSGGAILNIKANIYCYSPLRNKPYEDRPADSGFHCLKTED